MEEIPGQKKETIIRTPDHRLRVFISSTLRELGEEREIVRQAVQKLRLLPVMFEAGARPHPAQELYQAYLSQSHIFIGIYWQSYGWVGPGMDISGLEDEYNRSASLPRLIYIKSPAPERDPGLERLLKRLQTDNTTSYKHFSSSAALGEQVENDLALLLTESYETASRGAPAEFSPRPLTNIPFPRNPLLGRERELKIVCDWLTQETGGFVTLTGVGGSGKSRLALEAALELRDIFIDGVYLVRLAPVSDPGRVIATIVETLGLHERAQGLPMAELLIRFLQDKRMLLVLDNFEQVLAAAPQVADLLEACPNLSILVTSRAPLHLRGERELVVQPLAVPALKEQMDLQRLSQYASVQLFIQRAQSLRPDFTVTNENAPAVAEICYRLDGLPLAIELAAARIKLIHPGELLKRLGRRFDILRGGTRDLPERQQTLRAAIDWSYELLPESARALFRRLAVFAGSWSLEAAEAVCNLDGDLGASVFEEIESLVDSSLVSPVEGLEDRQRFGMLESIREYALERLEESGEAGRVRCLHAEEFLRFVREVEPRIRTSERAHWSRILAQENENIRAALEWGLADPAGPLTGQQIIIAMGYSWIIGGSFSEGRQFGQRYAAQMREDTPDAIRAGLLTFSASLSLIWDRNASALSALEQALQLARQVGDPELLAICLVEVGLGAMLTRDFATATASFQECIDLGRETGDEWKPVLASIWLGIVATMQGEEERAAEIMRQALILARRQGDPWCLMILLASASQGEFLRGDLDKAEATMLEAEPLCRSADDNWTLAWILNNLSQISLQRGDLPAAGGYTREALQLAREYGNAWASVIAMVETAVLLTLRHGDQPEALGRAARLCGAGGVYADKPVLFGGGAGAKKIFDLMVAQVRSAMDAEIWDHGSSVGAALSLDKALEMAAAELSAEIKSLND